MKNGVFWDVKFLRSLRRLLVTASVVTSSPILVTLMKEALSSSETSVLTRTTQRNIPEDVILHSHRRENLKSNKIETLLLGHVNQLLMFSVGIQDYEQAQLLLLFSSVAFSLTSKLHLSVCQHILSPERPAKCSEPFVKSFITALATQKRWRCVQML
jgi:hypothetical protein